MQQHLAREGIEARPEWAEVTHVRAVRCARCHELIPEGPCTRRTVLDNSPSRKRNNVRGEGGFRDSYYHNECVQPGRAG